MEPITLGFLLAAALSGVIGNKADKAVDIAVGRSIQAFTNRRQQEDESVYRELQKAISRSFLLAQQSIASECLKALTTGTRGFNYAALPGHEADVRWLEQKLKRLEKELKQVKQGKTIDVPIAFGQIEPLFTPEGGLAVNSMQAVREKLIAAVRAEGTVPYYQAKVEDSQAGLFEQMRRHFASQILHNAVLNNFFQGQLLTQINANLQDLQAQQIHVRDWENGLQDLARNVSQEIAEIKELLKQLAIAQSRQFPVPLNFKRLIAEKTEEFVGREFVFTEIERFFQEQSKGYFIIEADPGMGKSALLAEFVRRNSCIVHFNNRSEGITSAEEFLRCVCTQLIEGYQLSHSTDIQPENLRNGNFLSNLLEEVTGKLESGERLVIAVDALDEVDLSSPSKGANVLYLPQSLPENVFFVVTKRPLQLPLRVNDQKRFNLMRYEAENQQDVQDFIGQRIHKSQPLQQWIHHRSLKDEEFVTTLAAKSESNFEYLRHVLPAIEQGDYQDLNIENLPQGLENYYEDHWERMGMNTHPLPEVKIKIVYVLATALEPVSRGWIVRRLDTQNPMLVVQILKEWDQFLREQQLDKETRYSLYHSSFRDFL
ncbi:MAG: hypothetical protein AB1589_13835, partial [Cyanobacteriota bacterium]